MPKKRLIFALLHEDGYFIQSRNFRRQRVGDLSWLSDVYGFHRIAESVDELIVLNISEDPNSAQGFLRDCEALATRFFAPISIGGGLRDIDGVRRAFEVGAEKVVLNSVFERRTSDLVDDVADRYGRQAIVASVDLRRAESGGFNAYVDRGSSEVSVPAGEYVEQIAGLQIGELMLGSIDRDGTGMGFDLETLELVPAVADLPVVVSGGAGNHTHIRKALATERVDGAATANLLNFVGDGLAVARSELCQDGVDLATWTSLAGASAADLLEAGRAE